MKKTAALALLCAALLLLTACAGGAATPDASAPPEAETPEELPEPVNQWRVNDDITLYFKQSEYPVGTESLTLILENRGEDVMLYGQGWVFEKYADGGWVSVTVDEAAFTSEGYTLYEHGRNTFPVSTYVLKQPLDEGLYRVTGCALRVAADGENLGAGGAYTEYPAWRLEFLVTADASPEEPEPETEPGEWELPEKEDWQWYTPWDFIEMYRRSGMTVWEFVEGEDGLLAALYREDTPENEMLGEGARLMLDLCDRKTGARLPVFGRPSVTTGSVSPAPEGGFTVQADEGARRAYLENGEVRLSDPVG